MTTYWVPGVNHRASDGRWAFAEFGDVFEIENDFAEKIEAWFAAVIDSVTATDTVA